MEFRKSKRRDSFEKKKSLKLIKQSERKYLFKYYPKTGKFIKTIS